MGTPATVNTPPTFPFPAIVTPSFPTPSPSTMVQSTPNSNTLLNMPIPGSRLAPEKYKGDYSRIRAFISHYEILCDYNNVITGADKCETIIRYCSNKVRQVILGLPSYTQKDWRLLKSDLLLLFDAERDTKRYRVRDLTKFLKSSKNKSIRNLGKWKRYVRNFIMIAGWLLEQKKLSPSAHATYFWNGIPRVLRNRLEGRILAKDPTRDLAEPFSFSETSAAAEALFQRDRFDMNMMESDDDDDNSPVDDSDDSDADSDSDSESDEDDHYKKSYKRRKNRSHKKHQQYNKESDDEDLRRVHAPRSDNRKGKNAGQIDEVESLIKEMNGLHVGDPQYGLVYWKAIKMDSDVRLIVPEPQLRQSFPPPRPSNINRHLDGSSRPIPTYRAQTRAPFQYQGPPHIPNTFQASQPPANPMQTPQGLLCYGCRAPGHTINQCPKIENFIRQNVLIREANGRLARPDGSWVSRLPNETMVEALDREQRTPVQSNFVSVNDETDSEDDTYQYDPGYDEEQGYESDDEADTYLAVPNIVQLDADGYPVNGIEVYPVERQVKSTTTARREVMDGVVIPTRQRPQTNAPKLMTRIGAATRSQTNPKPTLVHVKPTPPSKPQSSPPAPRPVRVPITRPAKPAPSAEPSYNRESARANKENIATPFDVVEPRYQGQKGRQEEVIEDVEMEHRKTPQVAERLQHVPGPNVNPFTNKVLVPHRQSAVSSQVAPIAIVSRILNSPITVAVGDILGVSKEVTGLLTDSLRTRAPKSIVPGPAAVATAYRTDTRGFLIKLQMDCNDRPITAIIDTGSQLNIVSHKACSQTIKRPIDLRSRVMMNDANGTSRALNGLVENVPLHCGGLQTTASLHVGKHVPFDLLLGRPWQRGNYVSIDERTEGTYLLFRDPDDLEGRYEILVQPDDEPHQFPFDPSLYTQFETDYNYPECFSVSLSSNDMTQSGNSQISRSPSFDLEPTLNDSDTYGAPQTVLNTDSRHSVDLNDFEIDKELLRTFCHQNTGVEMSTTLDFNNAEIFQLTTHPPNWKTIKSGDEEDEILSLPEVTNQIQQFQQPHQYIGMPYQSIDAPAGFNVPALPPLSNTASAQASAPSRLHTNNQRTTPEMLLLGLGDIGHLQRTGQSQPMILSTNHAVHLGTARDSLGFQPQRILAMQCALLPDPNDESPNRVINYGSAEIIFYQGIGGEPPEGWGFPSPTPHGEGVSNKDLDVPITSSNLIAKLQPPRLTPVQINGRTVGHTGHRAIRTHADQVTAHALIAPPPYPGTFPSTPLAPILEHSTVVTRPAPIAPSVPRPQPYGILQQLLRDQEPHDPLHKHVGTLKRRYLPPPSPPFASSLPRHNAHSAFTAISPTGAVAPSIVSCEENSSLSASSSDSSSDREDTDYSPNLLYPHQADYTSEEEMDWEGSSQLEDGLEEGELDELLSDESRSSNEVSNITKDDVESARQLMRMPFGQQSIYANTTVALAPENPHSTVPIESAFILRPVSPPARPFDHVPAPGLHVLADAVMSSAGPLSHTLPRNHPPLTRSKSRFVKKPNFFTTNPLPKATDLLNRVISPHNRPQSPLKSILPPSSHDIQVYCVTIPPTDSIVPPKLLEDALLRRRTRIAQEKFESQTLQSSSSTTILDSEPPRSPSWEPAQLPLSPMSTEPNSPVSSPTYSPTPSSLVPTRPNSPDLSPPPLESIWRTRKLREPKGTGRKLRSHTKQQLRASKQWKIPPGSVESSKLPTPTITSSTQALSLTVAPGDTVINHDPATRAYPTPIINQYAADNVRLTVPMDQDNDSQSSLIRHGTSSPPVIVPLFPTTDELSHPPAPLPLSHSFRQHDIATLPAGDERKVPICDRTYHGEGDFEYSRPTARVHGYFNIDTRNLQILQSTAGIPSYNIKRFTILGGVLEPFILPFIIDNTPSGYADIPPYRAHNWRTRLAELHNLRNTVRFLIDDITKCLTYDQHTECYRYTLSVFRLRNGRLIPTETNRAAFLARLHPTFNATITHDEESFIRSAIYVLRDTPAYLALADAADLLLRTANYDSWLITELIAMECLGNPDKDHQALAFIEAVDNEHITERYEEVKLYKRDKERADAQQRAEIAHRGVKRMLSDSDSEFSSD